MDRQLQRSVNQIKHLTHSAGHVYDRVMALCPTMYRYEESVADGDHYGEAWHRVQDMAFELVDALEDLGMLSEAILAETNASE